MSALVRLDDARLAVAFYRRESWTDPSVDELLIISQYDGSVLQRLDTGGRCINLLAASGDGRRLVSSTRPCDRVHFFRNWGESTNLQLIGV